MKSLKQEKTICLEKNLMESQFQRFARHEFGCLTETGQKYYKVNVANVVNTK